MTRREETIADIIRRHPALPESVAEIHWRKSAAFLRMLARRYEIRLPCNIISTLPTEAENAATTGAKHWVTNGVSRYEGYR